MAFDFPASPTVNQVFTGSNGAQYLWNGVTWNQVSGNPATLTAQARNRVVNPAFQISQELGFGVSFVTAVGAYATDQWRMGNITTAATPTLITRNDLYSGDPEMVAVLRFNSGTAATDTSIAAGDVAQFNQPLEGKRMADFKWGTAQAKPAVLRFRAAGSAAGTYCVVLRNFDNSRSYTRKFDLTTAMQWFSFAIPGDVSGAWPTDNTVWGTLGFCGMAGTTFQAPSEGAWVAGNYPGLAGMSNMMSALSQTIDLAAVGLYLDDQATGAAPPWVMPDEAQELAACQRYWYKVTTSAINIIAGIATGASQSAYAYFGFPVTMRTTPGIQALGATYANASNLVVGVPGAEGWRGSVTAAAAGSFYGLFNYWASARM